MKIEKKFLIKPNTDITNGIVPYCNVEQVYLSVEDPEIMIRECMTLREVICTSTIKSSSGAIQKEVEIDISHPIYTKIILSKLYEGNIINKAKYHMKLPHTIWAKLNVFRNTLSGLSIIEIGFKNEKEANMFTPPEWFGKEVTNNKEYYNANLAINGLPSNKI